MPTLTHSRTLDFKWYPPILVTLNVHGHNFHYRSRPGTEAYEDERYTHFMEQRDELLWLVGIATESNAKFSFQLNGEYAQAAIEYGKTAHLRSAEDQGNTMSVHFHWVGFNDVNQYWLQCDRDNIMMRHVTEFWSDHVGFVDEAIGHSVNRVDVGVDAPIYNDILAANYGLSIETISDKFAYTRFNTNPFTAFRRKEFTPLLEDQNSAMISIPSFGQVGLSEPQGLHAVHTSVTQLQRHFLMVVTEWRERIRLGLTPRVFSFGARTHLDQNAEFHSEMIELVRWLKQWTERTTFGDYQVASFASDEDVRYTFEMWERYFPGESSFSFDYENSIEDTEKSQEWPYILEGIVIGLKDAELDRELTAWHELGVTVIRLDRRVIDRGLSDSNGQETLTVHDEISGQVYLMWSDAGEDVTIDFSKELSGLVRVIDGKTGVPSLDTATSLTVTERPMLVELVTP